MALPTDPITNTVMIGILAVLFLMLFLVILYHYLFEKRKAPKDKIEVIEQNPEETEEQVRTVYEYGEEE